LGDFIEHGTADQVLKNPRYLKTKCYVYGEFIEEPELHRELNLKGTACSDYFERTKHTLEEMY
jgi:hypothetical protein